MALVQFSSLLLIVLTSGIINADNDGICSKTWKTVQTVRQSYIHTWYYTYWGYCRWERCRKRELKSRIETRIKYEDVPHKLEYCCNGYEKHSSDPLVCAPKCTPSCILGNCTSPGVCTCFEGHTSISSFECQPICDPNCTNAKCVDHNKCTCLDGYEEDPNFPHICIPVCKEQCVNSQCIKPDVCQCADGYIPSEANINHCIPHCDNCMNGKCTKPNYCECNKGYHKEDEKCVPYCSRECLQSKCTSPEKCTCNEGYVISNPNLWNLCIPYCSKTCINGMCLRPEQCTCYTNYSKFDNYTCNPICSKVCTNGKCIEPETCGCLDGYKPITDTVCEPDCQNECINGYCSEPNNCTCNSGFMKNEFDDSVCEPYCEGGCLNGNCTQPNVCTCNSDHIKVKQNVCMPICNDDCDTNFDICQYNRECAQIGKHSFSKSVHYTSNDVVFNLNEAVMTLNWSCSDIFNTSNAACLPDDCESCSSLPLSCISEINFNHKHIDFVCTKFETEQNFRDDLNETDIYLSNSREKFSYSIILIHPEELHGRKKGKCNVCLCGTNLNNFHDQNEAQFYFTPCRQQNESIKAPKDTPDGYLYVLLAIILVIGTVILGVIVYKIRTNSASYRMRKEQTDNQELTVEDELEVNSNNIHEDD